MACTTGDGPVGMAKVSPYDVFESKNKSVSQISALPGPGSAARVAGKPAKPVPGGLISQNQESLPSGNGR
jgi:hypothetical protein